MNEDFVFTLIKNAVTEKLQTSKATFETAKIAEQEKRDELTLNLDRLNQIAIELLDASGPALNSLLKERQTTNSLLSVLPAQIGETARRRAMAHLYFLKEFDAVLLSEYEATKEALRPLVETQNDHRRELNRLRAMEMQRAIDQAQHNELSQDIWHKMHAVEAQMKPLRIRLEKLQTAKDIPNNRAAAYSTTLHHPDHVWKQAAGRAGQEAKKMALRKLQQTASELALV